MPRPVIAAACLAAAFALPAPALAQTGTRPPERTVAVPGVPAAGPSKYDRTFVTKIGSSKAETVLVLVPGFSGGAGDFTFVGRDLVRRVPGLQVWAVDRRSQALEDTSMFERGLKGQATPQQVFDFHLGWITDPSIEPRYGARAFVARSRVRGRDVKLVDRGKTTSHLDPLTAAPETNDFLKTAVPWLRRVMRPARPGR